MPRYQLKDKCLFVDAFDTKDKQRKPDAIPYAHVLDQTNSPANKYLKLNDTAGFITRFILLGVDTHLIPQILQSEFGGDVEHHQGEVSKVVEILGDYLVEQSPIRRPMRYPAPDSLGYGELRGGYSLDFGVYSIATVTVKLPPYQIPRK